MSRTITVRNRILPLLALSLSLAGCFSLSRGTPVQTHYVLGGDGPEGGVSSAAAASPVPTGPPDADSGAILLVGLRPTEVADYLANAYIVVRRGSHRVGFSEFDRWGEDLARGVTRTLAGRLAAEAPGRRVETAPWAIGVRPDRLVQVRLLRFEGVAPADTLVRVGEAHLLATWEILDGADGTRRAYGITEVRSPGWTVGDFDALVGLLDDALGTLAGEISVGLGLGRVPQDLPGSRSDSVPPPRPDPR